MLQKRPKPPDPRKFNEIMVGVCQLCGTKVEVEKWQAMPPTQDFAVGKQPGVWNDLYYTECPTCKANSPSGSSPRVFVMKKQD
jgi:hypothetical protein